MYNWRNFGFEWPTVWHMIVGGKYLNVKTKNLGYTEMLQALAEELGEDFHKPVALISYATIGAHEDGLLEDLDIIDHEFLR